MTHLPTILRLLLGLGFTVFGLNYFLEFLPPQDAPPAEAGAFLGALASSKLLALAKGIELGAGLLLLANRFVPLALAVLAPILVGMTYYHAALDPAHIGPALGFVALELGLAWSYRGAFAPMLRARVSPAAPAAGAELRAAAVAGR
jgi:uncharacterized membrane protein YphA (DoxX/SURF4 family)